MRGVISFESLDELDTILEKIGPEDYYSRIDAIKINAQLVEKYRTGENALWENVLSTLYKNE